MKEILVEGDITEDLKRLNVKPKITYGDKNTRFLVCEVSDEDFATLDNDVDTEDTWKDGGWRYSEGSCLSSPQDKVNINGSYILGWELKLDKPAREYTDLLSYFIEELQASVATNVAALAIHMAKANKMKLSELFKKYQG